MFSKNRKNNNSNKTRKSSKRNVRNRRNFSQRNNSILCLPKIVPDKIRVHLTVAALQSYVFSANDLAVHYSGNSVYNPGLGAFNIQPAGFIDWMHFYQKFRVYSSTAKFQMVNASADALGKIYGVWMALYPSRQSTEQSDGFENAANQAYARSKFVGSNTGVDKATLVNSMTTSRLFGVRISQEEDFSGLVDANPTNQWYWQLAMTGPDIEATEYPIVAGYLTLTYYVEFYERKPIAFTTIS